MLHHFLRAVRSNSQDPYFKQVALLLHGDGTNGAQNNTFLDSSTNNFSITRNGNTTQGTFTPYSLEAGYWSNFFDGNGDYLTVPADSSTTFGTGTFTIEFWYYPTDVSTQRGILAKGTAAASTNWQLEQLNTGILRFYYNNLTTFSGSTSLSANTWYHVAIVGNSTSIVIYLNGVQDGSVTYTYNYSENSVLRVGVNRGTSSYVNAYLSNLRVLKGTALYTSSFTPPTAPLTAITNTSLLTCQSNRFQDNSSNNFTLTRNGDVRVTAFSPFAPTSAYSTSVVGGSGYFDGNGDYLSVPASAQFLPGVNTDFTFEAWVYLTATPGAQGAQIVGTGEYGTNADWVIHVNSSRIPFFYINVPPTGLSVTSSTAINLFSWNHIAVTRSGTGSNNLKMFLNGVNVGQTSTNITLDYTGNNLTLGADENGDEAVLTGYISGVRLINGTGYTSITEPTAPPTDITNTKLLLNFTNAGIFDNAANNDLETVGNAQISTSVVKFGTGSMSFDGTGDSLSAPNNVNLQLATGNFTVEAWVYWTGTNANATVCDKDGLSGSSYSSYALSLNGSGFMRFIVGNALSYVQVLTSNTLLPTSQWVHLAAVKNGTTLTLYQNGTSVASATQTGTIGNQNRAFLVGYSAGQSNASYWNGYIDDLRVTKGIARYTANFTPPSGPYPNQ
jgi:hypothetical protein